MLLLLLSGMQAGQQRSIVLGLRGSSIKPHGHLWGCCGCCVEAVHQPGGCMLTDEALLLLVVGLGEIFQEPLLLVCLGLCVGVRCLSLCYEIIVTGHSLLSCYAFEEAWLH